MEERVTVLLAVWENWSIFSSNYLTGLEAFFYLTESESMLVKEQIIKLNNTIPSEIAKDNDNDKDKDVSKEDLESLKRKAKSAGISVNDGSTISEITAKLEYVEKFSKLKLLRNKEETEFSITLSSASTEIDRTSKSLSTASGMRVPGSSGQGDWSINENRNILKLKPDSINRSHYDNEEEDDIDGVPLHSLSSHNNQKNNENENENENGDYDSDLDGVAIDDDNDRNNNNSQIFIQNQHQNQHQIQKIDSNDKQGDRQREVGQRYHNEYVDNDDDDDDVDGVPFTTEVENNNNTINNNSNDNNNNYYGKRNRENELSDSKEIISNKKNDKMKNDSNSNKKVKVRSDKNKYDSNSDSDGDGDGPGRIDFL